MANPSKVALLIIGQELLNGTVTDVNIAHTARKFYEKGVTLAQVEIVPDDIDEIAEAVGYLSHKYDYVITSGGIGPTHDDVTVEGVAKAVDQGVIKHKVLVEVLQKHYHVQELTDAQSRMALAPEKAELLIPTVPSDTFFLPLVYVNNIYLLPGVPKFFAHYLEQIMPIFTGIPLFHTEICVKGIETKLASALNKAVKACPQVRFGSYPSFEPGQPNSYMVRITFEAPDRASLQEAKEFFLHELPDTLEVVNK